MATDRVMPESRRVSTEPPWRLWFGVVTAVLVVVAGGIQFGEPIYRQRSAKAMIKRVGGEFRTEKGGPDWLRRQIGDERMTLLDVVERAQLRGKHVTDTDLAHLRGLKSLHFLALGRTQITDAGVAHLRELDGLQGLGFDGAQIGDAGLQHLGRLTSLQVLTLDDTHITDAGLAHLIDLPRLESLSLCNTAVTDSGLAQLKGLRCLRNLRIRGTPVTDAGIADLQRALPGLEICR
jgi:hypothetical protein